jgi:hypothetical protein
MSEPTRVHDHPVLGTVAVNSTGWWQTQSTVPLGGTDQVVLSLATNGDPDLPAARLDEAARILGRLDPQILRRTVAEHYLDLYNDTWCQDDEDLDHDGFCARITPTSVDIDEEGGVQVYVNDGGLFLGHTIVVFFDADLELAEIKLAG